MSPYRVLVDSDGKPRLIVAMLSVDKLTKRRRIFIVEKTLPHMWKATPEEIKHLAHMQISQKNTLTLAEYVIHKDDMGLKYSISRRNHECGMTHENIANNQYTQSDCLVAAMNDYTTQNDITVIRQL